MDLNFQKNFSKIEVPVSVRNSKSYIFEIVLLIVVAVVFYWFIVIPKQAGLKEKQSQLDQVKSSRVTEEKNVASLKNLALELSQSSQDVVHLDEALPLDERQVRTQALLDKLIQSSGVVVGNLTVDDSGSAVVSGNPALLKDPYAPARTLGTVAVNISVTGSLSQLLDLITKLENYGRIMEINSLDISAAEKGGLNLGLSLNTYYFGPQ